MDDDEPADPHSPTSDAQPDGRPSVTIAVYPDGPLIIRGDYALVTHVGEPIDPGRLTIALCRCGKSRAKPFCDGFHALARRTAEAES